MSLARTAALRSLRTAARPTAARAFPRVRTQLVAKRFASDGGHGHAAPSSDIPWAAAAVVSTVIGVYFVLPDSSHKAGGHHGEHHEEHAESKEEEAPAEEEEKSEEAAPPAEEPKEEKSDEGAEDSGKEKTSSETTGRGKMAADSAGYDDTRKVEDDSKGGAKKRVDSGLGQNLGVGSTSEKHSGSQEGASNTDTKHSTKIDEPGSGKSTKGEGAPETAKIKGPVDPKRPQV